MPVVKWRIYCETESQWTSGFLAEGETPTKCFTDTGHAINPDSRQILQIVSDNNVHIVEESTPTGGHFQVVSYKMECPVGVSTHDYSFIHPISALSITLNTTTDHTNDLLEVHVGPDTIVGTITSDANVSDTVINVSPTVLGYIQTGFYVSLFDGTNTDMLGKVISVDNDSSTITVESAVTQNFLAPTTYVLMTIKTVNDFIIGYPTRYELGKDKIGGSYIPAGTVIRVKYINTGTSSKDFYAMIDLLY